MINLKTKMIFITKISQACAWQIIPKWSVFGVIVWGHVISLSSGK